jgi:hypothetical protein
MRNPYSTLFEKPEGKRTLGKHRYRKRIILEWTLNRVQVCGLDSSASG